MKYVLTIMSFTFIFFNSKNFFSFSRSFYSDHVTVDQMRILFFPLFLPSYLSFFSFFIPSFLPFSFAYFLSPFFPSFLFFFLLFRFSLHFASFFFFLSSFLLFILDAFLFTMFLWIYLFSACLLIAYFVFASHKPVLLLIPLLFRDFDRFKISPKILTDIWILSQTSSLRMR